MPFRWGEYVKVQDAQESDPRLGPSESHLIDLPDDDKGWQWYGPVNTEPECDCGAEKRGKAPS